MFLRRQLLSSNGIFAGTRLVVIDSLHGAGNPPSDRRFYGKVYEFLRESASAGVTTLLLAHETKGRQIAGPRALEHACDATLILRRGIACRALSVPKNRYGPAPADPLSLEMDNEIAYLRPASLSDTSCKTILTWDHNHIAEIQVSLALPRASRRGVVRAPGLPLRHIEMILNVVSANAGIGADLGALDVTVRLGGDACYRREMNLAIAAGAIAAALRLDPPDGILIGDIDLAGKIVPPSTNLAQSLESAASSGMLPQSDNAPIVCGDGNEIAEPAEKLIVYSKIHSIADLRDLLTKKEKRR